MNPTLKKKLRKLILGLILIFGALFLFRLAYGYMKKSSFNGGSSTQFFENIRSSKKNYASKKYKVSSGQVNQGAISVDQKYEKIANIRTKSTDFEKEENMARNTIKNLDALIQFEQKSGNVGNQKLNLVIGVPPKNFDEIYNKLIEIGKVQAKQITKKDKTNEYKELNAKKKSLEKVRNSLIELKTKGGKIAEYMGLENRILEIEQQLQGLGVSLGDFDDENEFCTVQFSLQEGKEIKISMMHRIKVALVWTIETYLKLMATLFFLVLFAYLLLAAIEKLKIMEKQIGRKN